MFMLLFSGLSSRYRTVSGASVESVPPAINKPAISLTSLTGYIQQLRDYLPNASLIDIQVRSCIAIYVKL